MGKKVAVLFLLGLGLCLDGNLSAAEKYIGRLFTRGGPNTEAVIKVQVEVDSYTTTEEGFQLLQALNDQGWQPFITAFRQSIKGSIRFVGGRGLNIKIHVAEVFPKENGRKILLFTEKQAWEVDVQQRFDGRFPFMIVELNVDNKGNGEGKIYENAQIKLSGNREDRTGIVEMESYSSAPKVLFSVQLIK